MTYASLGSGVEGVGALALDLRASARESTASAVSGLWRGLSKLRPASARRPDGVPRPLGRGDRWCSC